MKQAAIRKQIDHEIYDHCKTINRMGWVRPTNDELVSYAFSKLSTGPRPCLTFPVHVVREVHQAVDALQRSALYKRMVVE